MKRSEGISKAHPSVRPKAVVNAPLQALRAVRGRQRVAPASGVRWLQHRFRAGEDFPASVGGLHLDGHQQRHAHRPEDERHRLAGRLELGRQRAGAIHPRCRRHRAPVHGRPLEPGERAPTASLQGAFVVRRHRTRGRWIARGGLGPGRAVRWPWPRKSAPRLRRQRSELADIATF